MSHLSIKAISFAFVSVLITSTFLLFPHDISGWSLFYLIFGLMFMMAPPQKIGRGAFTALFFVIIIHQIISIANAYEMTHIFVQPDSINFQHYARELASHYPPQTFLFNVKYDFYVRFLALFYLIDTSQLFAQELSILAFFLGCLVLIKIAKLLHIQKNIPVFLLCYGLFPSFLIYGSIIIREPWETLFLFLVIYQGILLITANTFSRKNAFYLVLFSLCMSLFHKGLFPCALILLTYFFVYFFVKFFFFQRGTRFFLISTFIAFVTITSMIFCVFHYGPKFITAIAHYRTGIMNLKGHFYYEVPLSSTFSWNWIYEVSRAYFYYLFGPFTFKDSSGLLLFIISKLRMAAIFLCLFLYKPTNSQEKIIFHTLLFAYFIISLIFALGVSNYGTGIRHHMLTDWILMVLLIPLHGFSKPLSNRMGRRITQQISSQGNIS